jgi:hypothetical protein
MNREPDTAEVDHIASTIEECRDFFGQLTSPSVGWSFTVNHAHGGSADARYCGSTSPEHLYRLIIAESVPMISADAATAVRIAMTRHRKQGRSKAAIARVDASWFKAHPGRLHRVRCAEEGEVQLPSVLIDRPILIAMRWTGKGCLYQPLFYNAGPPRRERMASILFAMAASHPDPVPVIRAEDALALAQHLRRTEALA